LLSFTWFPFLKSRRNNGYHFTTRSFFRGGQEEKFRTKLLKENHIDTVIGLPSNLFYSTGIPVCIFVLKKCKKEDDVLFINASEHYEKGKRQNTYIKTISKRL
jgi:type I restriction-modification system DNA methylase subunit